jgi:hypothetical protein
MKDRTHKPIDKTNIIIPNCLRVDMATIFLKSFSKIAQRPDKTIVERNKKERKKKSK